MDKSTAIETYKATLNPIEKTYFERLKSLIEAVYPEVMLVLFANQPYFYLREHETIKFHHRPSIMMAFFRDHVNLFSTANKDFIEQLSMYEMTKKHTLQIYLNQPLEEDVLEALFKESLKPIHKK